jgi:hypothetical protein
MTSASSRPGVRELHSKWALLTEVKEGGLEIREPGIPFQMNMTASIILGVFVFLTSVLVIAVFIWAAVKDGQEDKALQMRLGIRRRTRIGR